MNFYRLVAKEYRQFFRDRMILLFTLYLFTVDIIVAGRGFGISLKNAPFLVWDMAKTPISRELVSRMVKPYFDITYTEGGWDALTHWVERGDTVGAVVIPPGFDRRIYSKRGASALVLLDGSVVSTAMLSYSYLFSIASRLNGELVRDVYGLADLPVPSVDARVRVQYNENLNNQYYSALVELFMNVTMMSIIISSLVFVRERDYGTIEQIMVSPLPFWRFALAKLMFVFSSLLVLSVLGTVVAVEWFFKTPFRGSPILFFLITLVDVAANAGVGLLIAGFARRMSQVGLFTVLFLAPMLFLSGGWVPPESIPAWLRPLTDFSPLKYYLELGLGVVLKGVSFSEVARDFAVYVALSLGLLAAGYALLVKRVSGE